MTAQSVSAYSLDKVSLHLKSNTGTVEILHDIDLQIPTGQSVGIIGPSGSGKSSLLMLMAGLEQASAGRVRALGDDITQLGEDELARFRQSRMGVVFQAFHLIPTMTAVENVATPLEIQGRSDAFELAQAMLTQVGLADRADHYPTQLSGGEQQRVALARALVTQPKILLADEPTGNLDAASGQKIMDLMFDLQSKLGMTLVLVTHAPDLAQRCDRVVSLYDGRVAGDVTQ